MTAALRALALGVADLFRPRVFAVLVAGAALTLGLFIVLQALAFWALRAWAPETLPLPWIGAIPVATVLSWGSLALFPLMSLFLAAPVAAGFAGLFSERVSETVETTHRYPRGTSLGLIEGLAESLLVLGAVIAVAVATLILTPFLGPVAPFLFYAANGWLLGREFFAMVARRHLQPADADRLRRNSTGAVVMLGVGIALLLTVPVLNVLVPVLAAAAYTHLFHMVSARRG